MDGLHQCAVLLFCIKPVQPSAELPIAINDTGRKYLVLAMGPAATAQ